MKIEFIYKDHEKRVGYKLIAETEDDHIKLAAVRDMIFFGFENTRIVYDGREMTPDDTKIQALRWCTKQHQDREKGDKHI